MSILQRLRSKYIDTLPAASIDWIDLDAYRLAIPVGILYHFCFVGLLIYLTLENTRTIMNNNFLSPVGTANTDQICSHVPVTITGSFKGDARGNWNSQTGRRFYKNESFYTLTMQGTTVTNEVYTASLVKMTNQLYHLGRISARRDMMWNLLAWATLSLDDTVNHMTLTMNGAPTVIFGNTISSTNLVRAAFMTPYELCTPGNSDNYYINDDATAPPVFAQGYNGRYDTSKTFWYLQIAPAIDQATNTVNSPCPNVFTFEDYGFQGPPDPVTLGVHPDILEALFDMNSISTAIAVNYGILNISSLVAQPAKNYGPGISDLGSFYSNPRFSTMIPIFCLTDVIAKTSGRSVCYYQAINGNFLYPLATTKHSCFLQCGTPSKLCAKELPIHIGFISFNSNNASYWQSYLGNPDYASVASYIGIYGAAIELLAKAKIGQRMRQFMLSDPIDGDLRIQTLAEAAMGCATNVSCSASRRQQTMRDLCFGTDCTLLTLEFNLLNTALNAQSLFYSSVAGIGNGYNFKTPVFNCINSIYNAKAMASFAMNPPVSLIQGYDVCHLTLASSVSQAIGIAAGSASLYSGILLAVTLFICLQFINRTVKDPTRVIQSLNEKQALKEAEDQAFRSKMEKMLEYMEANNLFNMEEEKLDPIPIPTATEAIPYTLKSPKVDTIKFSRSFS